MTTSPACTSCLSVPQWRSHFVLTLLLAVIIGACSSAEGPQTNTPPPTTPPPPVQGAPDSGAVYVFTRDGAGVWTQQAYIKASNTDSEDAFGQTVALSGDTLVVGAHLEASAATGIDGDQSDNSANNAGAVYVFTRDAAGVWTQQAYIKASNTDDRDSFGSIALSGDTLAVGAFGEDSAATGINGDQSDNSTDGTGAVYVFTRDAAGVWTQQAYIKASNTGAGDGFASVALSGDRLVIGASFEDSAATGIDGDQSDNSATDGGATYVFMRDAAGVWSQQAYLKASNTDTDDEFGRFVRLSGDTLVVSAHHEDSAASGIDGDQSDNSAIDGGAAYVFAGDAAGVWSQLAYVKASNTEADDLFTWSVALSGNTLAVGARSEASAVTGIGGDQSDNSAVDAGSVYVFTRDMAGVWSQQAYIKASNTEANDLFGTRQIALSGDTLAVSATHEASAATGIDGDQSDNSASQAGAVYVYARDATGVWSQQAYVKASNTDVEDGFGWSVALSGDTLAVGARWEDSAATGIDGDQSNTGFSGTVVAIHAFDGKPTQDTSLTSNDVIPVAVLGSVNFDATQVDFSTARFGPGKASPIHDGHVEDANNDGIFDMVFHFNTQDTGIACDDFSATLSGETFGGDAFTGTDSFKIARCE